MIQDQDKNIEKQTERAAEREAALQRKFSALNNRLSSLEGQGQFMQARFAGAQQKPAGEG
jgi:flagellar capping protein FliD